LKPEPLDHAYSYILSPNTDYYDFPLSSLHSLDSTKNTFKNNVNANQVRLNDTQVSFDHINTNSSTTPQTSEYNFGNEILNNFFINPNQSRTNEEKLQIYNTFNEQLFFNMVKLDEESGNPRLRQALTEILKLGENQHAQQISQDELKDAICSIKEGISETFLYNYVFYIQLFIYVIVILFIHQHRIKILFKLK